MNKETPNFVTTLPAEKLQNFFGVFLQFYFGVDNDFDIWAKYENIKEVDICCKDIGILEMSKVYDERQKRNGIAISYTVSLLPHDVFLLGTHIGAGFFI